MSESTSESFDCVQMMRRIRERLDSEIGQMEYDELRRWLRSHRYSDRFLQRQAERAAQQAHAADEGRPGETGT
ncbi:MAG: hypothetical protein GF355_07290 [Candidatus Eisenbacteria bacterium]|nr:hypothetical protein [Candidatus Eisenbacteria bacterium]